MKISILGNRSLWFIILMANENNNEIMMWTKFEEEKKILLENKGNPKLLPNVKMPDNIKYTSNMEECVKYMISL